MQRQLGCILAKTVVNPIITVSAVYYIIFYIFKTFSIFLKKMIVQHAFGQHADVGDFFKDC